MKYESKEDAIVHADSVTSGRDEASQGLRYSEEGDDNREPNHIQIHKEEPSVPALFAAQELASLLVRESATTENGVSNSVASCEILEPPHARQFRVMRRRLSDSIKELSAKAITTPPSPELEQVLIQLKKALHEHTERLRKSAANYPLAKERRANKK